MSPAPPLLQARLALLVGAGDRLEIELAPGTLLLLQGPPGSGKTTLLRCAAGLLQGSLATGSLVLAGFEYGPTGPCPPGVAWVQQDPYRGFLQSTALEELASLEGAPSDEHLARHLHELGLEPHQDPRDMSRGEAWRLAFEAALHRAHSLLLLDEPSGSLDGAGLAWMARRLEAFLATGGAVLVAEHRPRVLEALPHRVLTLAAPAPVPAAPAPCVALRTVREAPVLRVRDLEAAPGSRRQVGPLTLDLHPGERVGLSGPNGCGKTTLLRAMAGLEPIRAGGIDGICWPEGSLPEPKPGETSGRHRELRHLRRRLRRRPLPRGLGLLPQRPDDLLFRPSVRAELEAAAQGCPAVPALLGLALNPELDPITLSHGQRLLLACTCVLLPAPPVVLLDEPSAWLDPDGEARLFLALDHLQRHHGTAVLVASHDPTLLARHCARSVELPPARTVESTPAHREREPPARSDRGVVFVLVLGLLGLSAVALTRSVPWLWLEVAVLLALLPRTPGWRRSLRRIAKRGGTLLLGSSAVLCLVSGWPDGLLLGLLTTGKALGAWLPAALALRSIRRADLRRLLTLAVGPRLGQAASLCIGAAPLLERVAARSWEQARLRRIRSPLAVLVPVLLRILSLATAQADMVALHQASLPPAPSPPERTPCPQTTNRA